MGVLACDREGCENIMCDTIIENQYICSICCEEFRNVVGYDQHLTSTLVEMFMQFMRTHKQSFREFRQVPNGESVDEFLERHRRR